MSNDLAADRGCLVRAETAPPRTGNDRTSTVNANGTRPEIAKVIENASADIQALLDRLRPAVRRLRPYHVGGFDSPPVKLNQNESPYDVPADLKREIIEGFSEIPFNRYPPEQPVALAHDFAEYSGWIPEGVLVGNGSNELTFTIGLSIIEKGTSVVLPRPMFSLYTTVARLHEADLIEIAPRADLGFDADAIVRAVQEYDPSVTVLTTPNNPTGLAMTTDEVRSVVEAASGFVVIDEAYIEFAESPCGLEMLRSHPNVIVLRTLSKAWGLAGLRLGFLLARPEVVAELLKARLPFMIDPLAQHVARTLLRHSRQMASRAVELRTTCQELTKALADMVEVEVIPSETNFVLFRTPLEPSKLMNRLAESGVLIRSMAGYPELHGFLRANVGTDAENNAFLVALQSALAERA